MKKKKVDVAEPPMEIQPKIQSNEERTKRLRGWENLLKKIPRCHIEKTPRGYAEKSGYLSDNREIFGKYCFVLSTEANLDYHDYAYMVLYFCFLPDGKFAIEENNNLGHNECEGLDDKTADILFDHIGEKADSWIEGYQMIIKIIEEAFATSIPEVPLV